MESTTRPSRFLKWAVIIGIIIVLNLFLNYALSLVYRYPEYQAFCPERQVNNPPTTKAACLAIGGQWNENVIPPTKTVPAAPASKPLQPQTVGYCNPDFTCRQNYESTQKVYERNTFVSLVVAGIAVIILGLFLRTAEAVTIGLSFGGVLSLIIASVRYWSYADNILKVVLLGAALLALIWIGIKKFQE